MTCDLKVFASDLEATAKEQIDTLASFEAFDGCKVRIMPDAHAGAGCVIGFTADLGDKVVPNLVGVDIGCGMYAIPIEEPDNWVQFDRGVRKAVPSGFSVHGMETCDVTQMGLGCLDGLEGVERLNRSLGTLGGGNHFIEVDSGDDGAFWLVIHSGSRNLGKQVADLYQGMAVSDMGGSVPKGLEYLTGERAEAYLADMALCQTWARANREAMAASIFERGIASPAGEGFHTVHNYIGSDNMVRKGAISAREGERVLIPFNMRDGAVIGLGLGNEDWNFSAPHGAGRVMSRAKAKKTLRMEDFEEQMRGIYSSTVRAATIDEAPDAYKKADDILGSLSPTVEVTDRLVPVYNFKAVEHDRRR